jgi:hypothetical protein
VGYAARDVGNGLILRLFPDESIEAEGIRRKTTNISLRMHCQLKIT